MNKFFLFFILLLITQSVFSQIESKYSHYTMNQLLINPAIAGSEKNMVNTLAYRYQWMNSGVKLHQKSFTCHLPFNQKRMGIVKFDKFGYIVTLKEEAQLSDYGIYEGEYLFIIRDTYQRKLNPPSCLCRNNPNLSGEFCCYDANEVKKQTSDKLKVLTDLKE